MTGAGRTKAGTWTEYRLVAEALAEEARRVLRKRFRGPNLIEIKDDGTPVTPVDREVEERLREGLARAFPEHGIRGEEFGAERMDAELVWVLDPIDGTKAFLSGKPLFGTLISLLHRGRPVVGVIEIPVTGERWVGVDGDGAFENGEPIHVRENRPLAEATLYTAFTPGLTRKEVSGMRRLSESVRWVQSDCDCYAYGLLARGSIDLVVEADLKPEDVCALVPVLRGAGARVSHWDGADVGIDDDGTLVAASSDALWRKARETLVG